MSTDFKLQLLLNAKDGISSVAASAGKGMRDLQERMKSLSETAKKVGDIGKGMMMAGAGITGAVGLGVHAFQQLEDSTVGLQNVLGTVNGMDANYDKLSRIAINLGNTLPFATKDAYDLATALHQGGASSEDMTHGLLTAAANLLVVHHLSADVAGKGLAITANAFKLTGAEAVKFADVINRTAHSSSLEVGGFFEAMKGASAPVQQLGLTGLTAASQMAVLMGALKNTGIDASTVGTAFREGIARMAESKTKLMAGRGALTKEIAGMLGSKGISLDFFDKAGNTSIPQLVAQMDKLKVLTHQQRMEVGASLFGPDAANLVLVGTAEYNAMSKMQAHAESLDKQIGRTTDTLSAKFKNLAGTTSNTLATVFEPLANKLKGVADRMNVLTGKLGDWAQAFPRLSAGIVGVTAGLGGLLVAGGGALYVGSKLVVAYTQVAGPMAKAMKLAKGLSGTFSDLAVSGLKAVASNAKLYLEYAKLSGGPVKGLLAMMGDMGGVAGKLSKVLSYDVGAGLQSMWKSMLGFIPTMWGAITATWAWTTALLANPMTWVVVGLVALVAGIVLLVKHWSGAKAVMGDVWGAMVAGWNKVITWFKSGFAWLEGILRKTPSWALWLMPFIGVPLLIIKHWSTIKGALGAVWTWIKGFSGNMVSAGANIVKSIAQGMMGAIMHPVEAIKKVVEKVRRFLPFSPAKDGPLQDIHRIRLVETIAEGVKGGPLVDKMRGVAAMTRAAITPVAVGVTMAAAGAAAVPPKPAPPAALTRNMVMGIYAPMGPLAPIPAAPALKIPAPIIRPLTPAIIPAAPAILANIAPGLQAPSLSRGGAPGSFAPLAPARPAAQAQPIKITIINRIDARGAAPGVEQNIEKAIQKTIPLIERELERRLAARSRSGFTTR